MKSRTLKGYLGKDPETRQTKERTFTSSWYNSIAEMDEPYDGRTRSRDYMVLSLATHENNRTTWYRLVVWSSDQLCHRNIRFAGKGDLVKVKGRPETFRFTTEDGANHELHQLIVERFRVLKRKRLPPEIP